MRVQTIFIACARASAHQLRPLVDDLRALGYVVYLDRDVPGGREWWARVLRYIEDANAFIYALTSATLDSEVCAVELDIAGDLHKPVLPVALEAGIKDASLPRAIGQIQRIGYSQPNRAALAQLFAAIEGLPAANPVTLSDPPAPPPGLHASMEDQLGVDDLDLARQDLILDQLEHHLRSGFTLAELDGDVQRLRARPEIARRSTIRLDGLRSKAGSATSWPSTDDLRSPPLAPVSLPRVRSAFISYSRHDHVAMTDLVNELETLGLDVWHDTLLPAGVLWWDQVLEQIRRADTFFLATSPASLGSAACISELRYARSLGKPALSLELADVGRPSARGDLGSVVSCRFVPDSKDHTRALARLVRQIVPAVLPDQLPPPPPIPASYVFDVRAKVRSAHELRGAEQDEILRSLRAYADEGIDHDDLRPLIVAFSRRPELLSRVEGELRAIAHFVGLDPATLFGDGAHRGPGDQHGAAGNDDERPTADPSGADAPADEPIKQRTKPRRANNTTTPPPKSTKQASTKKTASKPAGTPKPRTKAATPVPQKAPRSTSTGAKAGGGLFGLLVVVFFALRIGLPMWGSMAESCADGEYYDEYDGWFEHAVCAVFVNHSSS